MLQTITQSAYFIPSLMLGTATLFGSAGYAIRDHLEDDDEEFERELAESDEIELDPPTVNLLNPLDYVRTARFLQKQRKAGRKGWVKWYRIGSNWKAPKWVKPEREGSGRPRIMVDDEPYYFDRDAMLTDARTGAYVAAHIEGQSDPVNLSERPFPGLDTDLMERLINMEAENEPPGWFAGVDQKMLMWLGIGLLFVLFAAYRYMGGGM